MEPVGLQTQTPDIMQRLSQVLQIQGQKQALQGQAAEVAGAQQSQRQRAALAQYDFSKHLDADGLPDLNGLATDPELRQAAGDQILDVIAKSAAVRQQQLENRRSLVGLRQDQRSAFAELMGGLRGDPDVASDNEQGRQKVNQAMIQYGEMYGEDSLPVLSTYARQIQGVPAGKLDGALKAIQLQAISAANQNAAQQPNYLSTGGAFQQVNPNMPLNAAPQEIAATLPPGAREDVMTDSLGNPIVASKNQQGRVVGTRLAPGAGMPGGPAVFGPGERGALEAQANKNFENVTANRQAASMAPQQLDQIDKALALSRTINTSSWAQKRAQIESNIGAIIPGFDKAESDATKLQLLDKFAERIATDASRVLGVNARTDAERESIQKQNANIGYTPAAVQDVLKYAKAQTLAMQAKGDAQERWLSGGGGITSQHEFETKFRQAYDPKIFQLAVMSPEERKAEMSKMSASERTSVREKSKALIDLGVELRAE